MTLSAALSILANVGLFLLFLDVKRQNDALVKAVNYYQGVIEKLVRKNEKEDLELRLQHQGISDQAVR